MKDYCILGLILSFSLFTLYATAEEPAPSCVEERITIQKLMQQNAQLFQQLTQPQLQMAQKAAEEAKTEQTRLEALLPKKPEEQITPPAPPNTTTVSPQPPDTTAE